jgi:hypothetical protein
MTTRWTALALALLLGAGLAGCHGGDRSNEGGGGGGAPEVVPSNRLPESNNVNPSPTADTYLDDRSERQHR